MKVLILGASGMLGHAMLRLLLATSGIEARGTVRSAHARDMLPADLVPAMIAGVDVADSDRVIDIMAHERPEVVINCVGLVKQREAAADPLEALPINALLPHRLVQLCRLTGARLVHFSTDCVFDGVQGRYRESDAATPVDLYGRAKLLGEVDAPHAITLRTSMIGPELTVHRGLLDWFLAQTVAIRGYRKAIFSGLTTFEIAKVVRDYVLTRPELHGIYHVGSDAVSKFELLSLIGRIYGHHVAIEPDDSVVLDRSLDSTRFRTATGYVPPSWSQMIVEMRELSHGR